MVATYMKEHADRNGTWDKNQLGTCSEVLGTVDQLLIDKAVMDEVRNKKRNIAVAFFNYQRAYDKVRHVWMMRVYVWMGIEDKVLEVQDVMMRKWKTRLVVKDSEKTNIIRWINIKKGFL